MEARGWLVAAGLVAALVPGPPGVPRAGRPLAAAPAGTLTPPVRPVPRAAPPECLARDLVVEAMPFFAAPNSEIDVYLLNTGRATCSVADRPVLRAYTPALESVSVRREGGYHNQDLAPGQQTSFGIWVRGVDHGDCPAVDVARVVLSLSDGVLVVARPGPVCSVSANSWGGVGYSPPAYQPTVPWSGTIEPVTGVRPGAWATFRARMTNESSTEGIILRCLDPYGVRLHGVRPHAFQLRTLPCRPGANRAGVVPPGASKVVTLRVWVPHRFAGRHLALTWSFDGVNVRSTMDVERAATQRG